MEIVNIPNTDNTVKFIKAVNKMRSLQKQYFKSRNSLHLQASIQSEKEVDIMLNTLIETTDDNLKMF